MCSSAGRHSSTSQRATTCCFPASRETRWGNTGRPQRSLGKSIWWQTRGRTGFPQPTRVLVLVRPACDAWATGASWGPCCCWPPCTTCRTWLRLSRSCSGPTTTCRSSFWASVRSWSGSSGVLPAVYAQEASWEGGSSSTTRRVWLGTGRC